MRHSLTHSLALLIAITGLCVVRSHAQSAIPLGNYTAVFTQPVTEGNVTVVRGEYIVTFLEGDRYRISQNAFTLYSGAYTLAGDRITFTISGANAGCGAGTFQWRLQGNRLSFAPASDQPAGCALRRLLLTTNAFFKEEPPGLWRALGPEGGTTQALLISGGKIRAATSGAGIFVSADNGQTWRATPGFKGNTAISLAEFEGALYAGLTFGVIAVSTDGGESWERSFLPGTMRPNVQGFAVSNGRLFAAGFGDGVYRRGADQYTWERPANNGLTNRNVNKLAALGNNLFAATNGGVFVSSDGGENWMAVNNGLTIQTVNALAVLGASLYAGAVAPAGQVAEVFVTDDNGQNWRRLGNGLAADLGGSPGNSVVFMSAANDRLYATIGNGNLVVHENGVWRRLFAEANAFAGPMAFTGQQIFAGRAFEGVMRSMDSGQTWSLINKGLLSRNVTAVLKDSGVLYAGGNETVYLSRNEGQTWTRANLGVLAFVDNLLARGGKVYAGTANGVYVTADGGQSWTRVSAGLSAGTVTGQIAAGNALYAAVFNAGVFRSTDEGQNWTAVNTGLTTLQVNELAATGAALFVTTNNGGVFRSTDEGQNWTAVNTGLPALTTTALAASGANVFVGVAGQAIFRSADQGQTWTRADNGILIPSFITIYASGNNLYTIGDGGSGILRSPDGGQTWQTVNSGFELRFGRSFFASEGRLYAATLGGVYISASLVNQHATVSAASFNANAITEKAIVAAFGLSLSTATQAASAQPLPTNLAGTTVRVKDSNGVERLAPLFFVSPGQVNFQIPAGTATGLATVTITNSEGIGATGAIDVRAAALSIFTINATGAGAAAAVDAFTGAPGPFNATRADGQPNIISVFGTGLGGDATDVDGNVNASVTAQIGGNPALVQYAGRAPGFVGLNQFNLQLPVGIAAGTHTLVITRNGRASNTVTIAIR
jgi:uncharacterized protein (TIGR03437 family)